MYELNHKDVQHVHGGFISEAIIASTVFGIFGTGLLIMDERQESKSWSSFIGAWCISIAAGLFYGLRFDCSILVRER